MSNGVAAPSGVTTHRGWWLALTATVALALLSLASNVTTSAQLAGDADGLLTARWTVSKLLNAGVAWAGLPVLAGWLVRRPGPAAAAGVAAAVGALVVHYAVGTALGVFGPGIWTSNLSWFVVGLVHATRPGTGDAVLEALYLLRAHQGTGVAGRMMAAALGWLGPQPMSLEVAAYDARAVAFYRRHGFRPTGATSVVIDLPRVEMRCPG